MFGFNDGGFAMILCGFAKFKAVLLGGGEADAACSVATSSIVARWIVPVEILFAGGAEDTTARRAGQ